MNLAELFIVSNVAVAEEKAPEGAVVGAGSNFPGLTVAVTEATGKKCPRCWMHSLDADKSMICARAAQPSAKHWMSFSTKHIFYGAGSIVRPVFYA